MCVCGVLGGYIMWLDVNIESGRDWRCIINKENAGGFNLGTRSRPGMLNNTLLETRRTVNCIILRSLRDHIRINLTSRKLDIFSITATACYFWSNNVTKTWQLTMTMSFHIPFYPILVLQFNSPIKYSNCMTQHPILMHNYTWIVLHYYW